MYFDLEYSVNQDELQNYKQKIQACKQNEHYVKLKKITGYPLHWLPTFGLLKENLRVILSQHSKGKPTSVPVKFM